MKDRKTRNEQETAQQVLFGSSQTLRSERLCPCSIQILNPKPQDDGIRRLLGREQSPHE